MYERVRGETLELLGLDPVTTPAVYRALGRDLARLHAGVSSDGPAGQLGAPNLPQGDPRPLPEQLATEGYFSVVEARWLSQVYVNDLNSDAAAGYATASATLGYVARLRGWELNGFVRGDNLFSRRYAGSVIVNEGNNRFFEPAPGRTWLAGVSGSFGF